MDCYWILGRSANGATQLLGHCFKYLVMTIAFVYWPFSLLVQPNTDMIVGAAVGGSYFVEDRLVHRDLQVNMRAQLNHIYCTV